MQPASGSGCQRRLHPLNGEPSIAMTREKSTERFGLVLTPPEREGLRYLADLEGLAEADVLRRLLRMAINELPPERRQANARRRSHAVPATRGQRPRRRAGRS